MLSLSLGLGLSPRSAFGAPPDGFEYITYGGPIVTYNGEPLWTEAV